MSQGVGKSCLVLRYVRGQFDPTSKVTVGAAFMSHSVHLPDGTTIKFEIWSDTPVNRCASCGIYCSALTQECPQAQTEIAVITASNMHGCVQLVLHI